MSHNAEKLRKRGNRLIWTQAIFVVALLCCAGFFLFDVRKTEAPARESRPAGSVLVNLERRRNAAALELWLECHDARLFARSDTQHGYLAKMPKIPRPLPSGLEFERYRPFSLTLPLPEGFVPLQATRTEKEAGLPLAMYAPVFSGPSLAVPLSMRLVGPIFTWEGTGTSPRWLTPALLAKWAELRPSGEDMYCLRLFRAPGRPLRYEVLSGGGTELNEAIFRSFEAESGEIFPSGGAAELRIQWTGTGGGRL